MRLLIPFVALATLVVTAPTGPLRARQGADVGTLSTALNQQQQELRILQMALDQARAEGDFDSVADFTQAITTVNVNIQDIQDVRGFQQLHLIPES
jgi:hypothetical protein